MGALTFLALAYTLNQGGHIRVALVSQRLNTKHARNLARGVLLICACLSAFLTFAVTGYFKDSYHFGDVSTGIVPIPLWVTVVMVFHGAILNMRTSTAK